MNNEMEIVKRSLSELKQNTENIRLHPDKQIKEYVRSLRKNGQLKLIVIDEDNVIWVGNGLYQAMIQSEYEEAYCLVKRKMSQKDKVKMMMADNRIFSLGVDDMAAFDHFIDFLGDDLDVPGYDEDLLKTLKANMEDVDSIISSYGLIDDEKKEEMTSAKADYQKKEEAFVSQAQEYVPPQSAENNSDEGSSDVPKRTFITCPKCGEKIWL